AAGSRSTVATRSTFTEPTTMTRPLKAAIPPGRPLAGDELAAVDGDDVAADPVGVRRAQGHDRVRDVLRRRHPPMRVAREGDVDHPLVLGDLPECRRIRDAGPDRVDGDPAAAPGELHRQLADRGTRGGLGA